MLIQCKIKISLYLGPVRTVQPVWCFLTPLNKKQSFAMVNCYLFSYVPNTKGP